ncbi:MAG: glycosyltransferase family 2 protein [Myxococcota bacterium]|nr:glycosyltransferase family 2 protein [Myxococcota bacterium]
MSPIPELSVVVPVFDNTPTLNELIDRLVSVIEKLGLDFELVFVDDGSRDGSYELLRARADADPRIRAFSLTRNFGSQSAICAAFDKVRGKRTVCLDADLENFPEDIPQLLALLDQGHDLVCGVRRNRGDSYLFRRLPSKLLNAYVRYQTGTRVRDIGCGMRAMESWIVHDLASEGERRRLITPLLLSRARSVAEVEIDHKPKGVPGGHSFLTLLGIVLDYYLLTARRPFLVTGLLSFVTAGVAAVLLLGGVWVPGLITGAVGALGALMSLVGEYVQRIYQVGQGLPFYQFREDAGGEPGSEDPSD